MFIRTIIVTVLAAVSVTMACNIMPGNTFGVSFNDNESIDVSVIEEYGEDGTSYIREVGDADWMHDRIMYSYRSHNNPSVMVTIVISEDPSMDIEDLGFTNTVFFTINEEGFDLAEFNQVACVRDELEWLNDFNVINIALVEIDEIETSFQQLITRLQEHDVAFGSAFYWTKQDTLLGNSDMISSEGEFLQADCVMEDVKVTLPPEELEVSVGTINNKKSVTHGRSLINGNDVSFSLVDLRGRTVFRNSANNFNTAGATGVFVRLNRENGTVSRALLRK